MREFFTGSNKFLVAGIVIVLLNALGLAIYILQQEQDIRQSAWFTSQSAGSACGPDGKAIITVRFTNTEQSSTNNCMDVIVRDNQTGKTLNLGRVDPKQTKTGKINTGRMSLSKGNVVFSLTWCSGRPGVDSRTASYPAVSACVTPTPSPTVTITPTGTLTPTVSPTPSPTDIATPTPTIPICPIPNAVKNVRVECPFCDL